MSEEDRYQKALSAVQDEVLKIIGLDNLQPDVQHVLDIIESICRHGVDIRTQADKEWRPAED